MSHFEKSGGPTALCFISVHWKSARIQPARVAHMVGTAADGALIPGVDQVEDQRFIDGNGRVEAVGWLPGTIADAGDGLSFGSSRMQRDTAAVTEQDVPTCG